MITLSGRRVLLNNDEFPSLSDCATALSRLPRFGGQLRVWPWTVGHHSMLVHRLSAGLPEAARLAVLVHDFHEAVTGDVITSWKNVETEAAQDDLDHRLWREMRYPRPGPATMAIVHEIDRRALVAEGAEVAAPGWLEKAGIQNDGHDFVARETIYDLAEWKTDTEIAQRLVRLVQAYVFSSEWSTT